jgi:hypothetical protein
MRKQFLIACLLSAAAAAPLLLSAPAAAKDGDRDGSKFSEGQRRGYLGETSKSQLARSVHNRIKNKNKAPRLRESSERVIFWHGVTLDSVALDHTPDPDTGAVDFVQGGPGRTSRALAMTQIAVFDAVNAFTRKYEPYNDIGAAKKYASMDAAIAYAAHTMLSDLYPAQQDRLDALLASDIEQIRDWPWRIAEGREVGTAAAEAMLARRAEDNSHDAEPQFGAGGRVATGITTHYGVGVNSGGRNLHDWEPDPNTPEFAGEYNLSLGAWWGAVTPFVLERGDQFRVPPPPAPGSPAYIAAYNEVASLGGAPDNTGIPSTSTPELRFIGNFWGYDAVPLLGTPPRLYNQIALQVALDQRIKKPDDLARYLAMVNAALGDCGVAAWDSKWYYNYWRPVTAIRREDGVAETASDPAWNPVGVSVINTTSFIRPTPPFPAYPSGHATFAASMFEVLRDYFGNDTPFTFVSDEYNGEGVDPFDPSVPRPLVPVRYSSFQQAQEENGMSRIYNGVHWQYDNLEGQKLGVKVARRLLDDADAFQPKGRGNHKKRHRW